MACNYDFSLEYLKKYILNFKRKVIDGNSEQYDLVNDNYIFMFCNTYYEINPQ